MKAPSSKLISLGGCALCAWRFNIFAKVPFVWIPSWVTTVAEQLSAADAVKAGSTGHVDISWTRSPSFRPLDLFSDYWAIIPGEFMTRDHGQLVCRIPAVVDAPVCSADSCVFNLNENFIVVDLGYSTSLTLMMPTFSKTAAFIVSAMEFAPFQ